MNVSYCGGLVLGRAQQGPSREYLTFELKPQCLTLRKEPRAAEEEVINCFGFAAPPTQGRVNCTNAVEVMVESHVTGA